MGRYDDLDPGSLKGDLAAFARLLLRLDREDGLLQAAPELQRLMGDLRQKLFAYEIRATRHLDRADESREGEAEPEEAGDQVDPEVRESLRVVREALERERQALEEWGNDPEGSDPDEGDGG